MLFILHVKVVYKNNDVRLELSRLAKQGDPKMKVSGMVAFKCENVATLDPVTFETPESYITLSKWTAKKAGSISFDFRTTEPNGLLLFSHGKPKQQQQKDPKGPKIMKVDFFAIEMLDGHLYLLLDMGSGATKTRAVNKKVNDGEWYHVDFQRDGRSGKIVVFIFISEICSEDLVKLQLYYKTIYFSFSISLNLKAFYKLLNSSELSEN